jgi:acetylornithine deacetylase
MMVEQILSELVQIPSVTDRANGTIVDYVRAHLSQFGVASAIVASPEGDRFNLFATIGPADTAGYILSGHLDVVPADEPTWTTNPFRLNQDGERLIGRGSVDMKGFVACVLASVPGFLKRPLARPIHIALSYDEEIGCVGVRHLVNRLPSLCQPPAGCIVGEPTGMRPVLRHKGKAAMRVTVRGRSAHSSRPDLGVNAIHRAADVIAAVRGRADELASAGPFNPLFEPPCSTMQVGVVSGGAAVNIVPDWCVLDIEARAIPGADPRVLLEELGLDAASPNGPGVVDLPAIETEWLSHYPALDLAEGDPLVALTEAITGRQRAGAVSFGTEAGIYQEAGIPAIVCGPGDIARAHRPNEFILREELMQCMQALEDLGDRLAA